MNIRRNPLIVKSNRGNFGAIANNGSYFQTSDINYKKSIHYLDDENYTSKILQLKPARYLMKGDKEGHPLQFGFIAQQVEEVFPEFVITTKDNVKMVSYSSFIPIFTKGIQEQQQEIEILQKENTDLKVRMEILEKMVSQK